MLENKKLHLLYYQSVNRALLLSDTIFTWIRITFHDGSSLGKQWEEHVSATSTKSGLCLH